MQTINGYQCKRCGVLFDSHQQLGGHLSKGPLCAALVEDQPHGSSSAVQDTKTNNNTNSNRAGEDHHRPVEDHHLDTDPGDEELQPPPRTVPIPNTIYELLQRPTHLEHNHVVLPAIITQPELHWDNVYKLYEMQDAYDVYCAQVRDL